MAMERAIDRWSESWRLGGPVRCWAICDVATAAITGVAPGGRVPIHLVPLVELTAVPISG